MKCWPTPLQAAPAFASPFPFIEVAAAPERWSSVLLLLLLFAGSASANPMVAPAAGIYTYINSEKLTVSISPTGAAFRATFTFARKTEGAPPLEAKAYPATVQLPIWIPVESGSDSRIDAVTMSAAGGMLKLNTGGKESRVEDGESVTFSPKARQPIRARLIPGYSAAAPWLKVPNGDPTLQTR